MRVTARVVSVMVATALLASGCSRGEPQRDDGAVDVTPETQAVVELDSVSVTLPAGAVDGPGQLEVSAAEPQVDEDSLLQPAATGAGVEIHLTNASLVGSATLTFDAPAEGEQDTGLFTVAWFDPKTETWVPLESVYDPAAGTVSASTSHFSLFALLTVPFKAARDLMVRGVNAVLGHVKTPVSCRGEREVRDAGWQVTSDDGERVAWCLGQGQGDAAQLKVASNRTAPLNMAWSDTVSGPRITGGDGSVMTRVQAAVATWLLNPHGDTTVALLGGQQTATFDVPAGTDASVTIAPSGEALVVSSLAFALQTVTTLLTQFRGMDGAHALDKLLVAMQDFGDCANEFTEMATADVTDLDGVREVFASAAGVAFSCVGDLVRKLYPAGPGLSLVFAVASWMTSALQQGGAYLAQAVELVAGNYTIVVRAPEQAGRQGFLPCDEASLRSSMSSDGSQPLLEGTPEFWLDTFIVHACAGNWAVVEASHSSGSVFSFWLMNWQAPYWIIEAAGGAGLDTPVGVPAFAVEDLKAAGVDPEELIADLGTSTLDSGRPIVAP